MGLDKLFRYSVMCKSMKAADPQRILRALVKRYGSQKALAAELRVAESYLSEVLKGRRPYSDGFLSRLNLKRIIVEKSE